MYQTVFEAGLATVEKLRDTQQQAIEAAARLVADGFLAEKRFFVSGSGHSHMLAEELYGRAGGLAFVTPILTSELTLTEHPTKSSHLERLSGYAAILGELYGISEGDVVLIASNSGRNAYPVELALYAREHGAKVIAVTSVAHSAASPSRAPCGKRLMELADVVIDNCGVLGDACLTVEGVSSPMMATSTITAALIAQALSVLTAQYIRAAGAQVPVFSSFNADGATSRNEEYFQKYTRMY